MKLSFKFFYVAYIVVLVSIGISGLFLIKLTNDTLWNMRIEQAQTDMKYASDSFLELMDISYNEISENELSSITNQIASNLDQSVVDVAIYTKNAIGNDFLKLDDSHGISQFIKSDNLIIYKSVFRLDVGGNPYYIVMDFDFTSLYRQCQFFWNNYRTVAISMSVISGLLLFILSKGIVKPLNQLTKTVNAMALGNYGEKVTVGTTDDEIFKLSKSFNMMSSAVEQKILEITEEAEKRKLFVADFTHELKTPMTSIIGYSQMLSSYQLNELEIKEAAQAINHEAKHLEKLSLQLLDLYVIQNENTELERLNLF